MLLKVERNWLYLKTDVKKPQNLRSCKRQNEVNPKRTDMEFDGLNSLGGGWDWASWTTSPVLLPTTACGTFSLCFLHLILPRVFQAAWDALGVVRSSSFPRSQ